MATNAGVRMSRLRVRGAVATVAALSMTAGVTGAAIRADASVANTASTGVTVVGTTPFSVSPKAVRLLHRHDGNAVLSLVVGLEVRNSSQLDEVIRAASTPGSPQYGSYLTRAQYRAMYAPTDVQVAAVRSWLERHGMQVTGASPDNLLIDTQATTAVAEQAFGVAINDYTVGGRQVFANSSSPTVPADLNVRWVTGLDDNAVAQTFHTVRRPTLSGSPPYFPSDFRQAYNVSGVPLSPPNFSGDETIGFTLWGAPLQQSDLDGFASNTSSPRVVIGQAGSDGIDFIPCTAGACQMGGRQSKDTSSWVETAVDVESAHGVAPGAHLRYWLASTNSSGNAHGPALENAVNAAANDPSVHVVSNSWGYPNQDFTDPNLDASLQEAAAVGTTFFFATGDGAQISYPATSPYVVAVGGTTLNLDSHSNYVSESAWAGSGNGCSNKFSRPSWQVGVAAAATCPGRAEPDVAADADLNTGAYVYVFGSGTEVGGTSLSAPLWTGMAAVWNEFNHEHGHAGIGFVTPLLYAIANHSVSYARDFHDVTTGQAGGNPALPGWDEATGWGSPNLAHLVVHPPAMVPGAPSGVTAVAGDASASVSWTAPADNDSPISSYTVRASPGLTTVTAPSRQTTATVHGLTNGTTYTFTVTATNRVGTGQASAPSNPVTPSGGPPIEVPHTEFAFPVTVRTPLIPAVESWPTASDPSGICRYDLRDSVAGGPFAEVKFKPPTSTSVALSLNPSSSYRFEVNVTNCLGQSSGWGMQPSFAPIVWQESSQHLTYHGSWATQSLKTAYGGALNYSTATNASVSATFQGTEVAWISETGPTLGSATVFVDGIPAATVDLSSAVFHPRQLVWTQGWSTQATHTIKIVVNGTAGHPRVDLDAILTFHVQ
jgi:kumamolisin